MGLKFIKLWGYIFIEFKEMVYYDRVTIYQIYRIYHCSYKIKYNILLD